MTEAQGRRSSLPDGSLALHFHLARPGVTTNDPPPASNQSDGDARFHKRK